MPAIPRPDLHPWNLPPAQAIALQKHLATRVVTDTALELDHVHLVAGVDVSVKAGMSHAAIVVMTFPALAHLETTTASLPTPYPYIPGLLSFREGEVILRAYTSLRHTPDVLLFDGQGRIHPRRLGIAAHLGLWLDRPTVGCAKSPYIGHYTQPDMPRGSSQPVQDVQGETLGLVLRTRAGVKPVFVSPGHRCDLASAHAIVMACVTRYRLPEPIRAAHRAAGAQS